MTGKDQESSNQKNEIDQIFHLLKENKIDEVRKYIVEGNLDKNIECVDEHGTTPLQYAAFRGLYDICELLIKKGADVNAKTHDQGYSALMFAAISNHTSVVSLLLENDADVDYTNTIGRTASQMASFVNSHESVDLINSYVSKKSLEYFTETHSISETEPKLPKGECLDELHKLLINTSNMSPIRLIKLIKNSKNNVLMENADRVIQTLNAFVEKSFKNAEESCPNDVLSFKLHYFKYLFEFLQSQLKILQKKNENTDKNELNEKLFDLCMKKLISEEEISVNDDGLTVKRVYRVFEEKFLRESIRQFPYKECALLRQMVLILSKVPVGSQPRAQYVITSCLHGQKLNESLSDSNDGKIECATCTYKSIDNKWCTHCKQVAYCDRYCQQLHWSIHKKQIKST